MKIKHLIAGAFMCLGLSAFADGYTDGIDYYKAGQYDNARTLLNRNLSSAGDAKALVYYYLGQIDLIDGNMAEAKANFNRGIGIDAECAYNYVGLGALALRENNEKAAEEYFKQALKLAKKNHEITVDIARAYFNADPVKYDKEVNKYLEKAHKDSKHQEPSIYILEGDMLFAQKAYGDAATKYNQAINFDSSTNPEGYVKYANTYFYVSPQFAIQKLNELLEIMPNSALGQRELAEKYYNNSQWTKAAEQYGKYINNPNHFPEDKARYAVLLYANNEYQKSLDVATEILASNPDDFQSLRLVFLNLAALERNEEARAAADKFFALPEKGNAKFMPNDYTTFGSVLQGIEEYELAVEQYLKAYEIDNQRIDNLKLVSSCYNAAKDYVKAAEAFQTYIDQAGDKASLNDYFLLSNRMLRAAATVEDYEARVAFANKGIAAIDRVIEGAEPSADFYFNRAMLQAMATPDKTFGPDALPTLLKVVEILDADPANADPANASNQLSRYNQVWSFIASIYQLNGDDDAKRAAFDKADYYKGLQEN